MMMGFVSYNGNELFFFFFFLYSGGDLFVRSRYW